MEHLRIALISSEELRYFPPMISLLNVLDRLGHEVTLMTPYQDEMFSSLQLRHARQLSVADSKKAWLNEYTPNHLKASFRFHTDRLLKRGCLTKLPKKFKAELADADVVWVLHENTMLLGGKKLADQLGSYLYTMYELCIKNSKVPEIYAYAARKALLTVVPEYCRAHIVEAYYSLPHHPAIIPNKPLEHPACKNMPISDPKIRDKVAGLEAQGKKIIMYMGILSDERPLEPIIEAVSQTGNYTLAVLGERTPYLEQLEQKMGGRFTYLGEVKPPHHLEVASHADVAYVSYVAQQGSINAVFCAPNKVYEFAGFGIPMLCNDNPGLKFTVERFGMGVCAESLSVEGIRAALAEIDQNYPAMEQAARTYYNASSVEKAVEETLERFRSLREQQDRG